MKKKYFWLYKYCSTYTLKFFTTDIWCSPLIFTNVVLIDSPINLLVTTALSPHYQRLPLRLTDRMISCNDFPQVSGRFIWTWVVEVIAGNVVITRCSREGRAKACRTYRWIYKDNVCKEQWWAQNVRGEEFQLVGRTISKKSKILLIPYNW